MVSLLQLRMSSEAVREYWVFILGFLAQMLFGLRILVQWWLAEKRKEIVSPSVFWMLSLAASALFLVYGILRLDTVIIVGQMIGYCIYLRNLQLKQDWNANSLILRSVLLAVPFLSILWILTITDKIHFSYAISEQKNVFLWLGLAGQLLLNTRFLYQLYYSERNGASVLPVAFWWISLAGSVLVVIYSIERHDPVLLTAQAVAIIPYARNILLSKSRHTGIKKTS